MKPTDDALQAIRAKWSTWLDQHMPGWELVTQATFQRRWWGLPPQTKRSAPGRYLEVLPLLPTAAPASPARSSLPSRAAAPQLPPPPAAPSGEDAA